MKVFEPLNVDEPNAFVEEAFEASLPNVFQPVRSTDDHVERLRDELHIGSCPKGF